MTPEQKEFAETVKALIVEVTPAVEELEQEKFPTTKDNYGSYLALLSGHSLNRTKLMVLAYALIKAGANKNGVAAAFKICSGWPLRFADPNPLDRLLEELEE